MSQTDHELPSTWTVARVRDVGRLRLGRQRSQDRLTGRFSTPYLRAANVTVSGLDLTDVKEMDFTPEERETFRLRRGDIVVTEASGSANHVGRPVVWNDELELCCFQNHLIRFRPHAVIAEYALLVFRHLVSSGAIAHLARGVGILHLGLQRFGGMSFPLPPFAEQERIAEAAEARLSDLVDAELALARALSRSREQVQQVLRAASDGALLESSDSSGREGASEPVTAPLQDDDTATESAKMAPAPWADLPAGWQWVRIDEVGSVQLGKKLEPSSHRGPNMRPYLRVANVQEDRLKLSDIHEMHFAEDEIERYRLDPGDILLNEGQSAELVGRPAMFRGERPELFFQMTLLRFRPGPDLDAEFALLVFRSFLHEGHFRRISKASTNIAHLSQRRFAAMPFPLPPLADQRRIVELAQSRLSQLEQQRGVITTSLEKTREMSLEILRAAVNGELVPQDANDEPAAALLARLGPPPNDKAETFVATEWPKRERPAMAAKREFKPRNAAELRTVLVASSDTLTLPELFRDAGFDPDEPADLEEFYLLLRDAVGVTIRVFGSEAENGRVEAVDDAT
jgi:restriction endonuclease S subunit